MLRFVAALSLLLGANAPAFAQGPVCSSPDSIAVRGNSRVSAVTIRSDAAISTQQQLDVGTIQRAIKNILSSGQFDDVRVSCVLAADSTKQVLIFDVKERPLLADVRVEGADAVSERTVRDRIVITRSRPLNPADVARAVAALDSLYSERGYHLARILPETTFVDNGALLTFRISEGRRLAISGIGVKVDSNAKVSEGAIVGAMKTKPEGIPWFKKGDYDEDVFIGDLTERLPGYFGRRGFIDAVVLKDTLVIDPDLGKGMLQLEISEGPQYQIGGFEIVGNRVFSSEFLQQFYPFGDQPTPLAERVTSLIKRDRIPEGVFDAERWGAAAQNVRQAYYNEGYIGVRLNPVVERAMGPDSVPIVNLRWEIEEGPVSIINRIDIRGNDYTTEMCIRDQLVIFPGSVFNFDRLRRSHSQISNLGFFEPLIDPEVNQSKNGAASDVDIVFVVTEKKTGNINFGASVGQGAGIGGFIGLDQPNLFGQCKRGSLQWQFGRLINDFNLSYTDPSIKRTTYSGKIDAYHTRSRYYIEDLGRQVRTGGSIRLGFPLRNSNYSRMFVSYGAEAVKYARESGSLLGTLADDCDNCLRSTLSTTFTRETRTILPFATAGSLQSFDAQFNGGPLGGKARFQRYTTELRSYAPLGSISGASLGGQPIEFTLGLTFKGGAVFGSTGPFFPFQEFVMGGTQQGEQLRGYDEFTITPRGYISSTSNFETQQAAFGRAFLTTTAEFGVRVSQGFYVNAFFDAGNVWDRPNEIDPTRLFRGAGVGVALITPLGPLGLDWAYGFDRLNDQGRRDPKWKLHFKLGQLF
jgi:outer membrane protein insertion porin family